MLVYTLRRLMLVPPILIAASLLTFLLVDNIGDPIANLIFTLQQQGDGNVPQNVIDAERSRLYLDRSMPERYWLWLTGIGNTNGDIGLLRGEWGPSVRSDNLDIGTEVRDRFFVTFRLVTIATILSIGLAIVTGVISAVKQYHKVDYVLTFVGFVALAMPIFWLAALIKQAGVWVNEKAGSTIFYTIGATSPDTSGMSAWEKAIDMGLHLILPTLALMLGGYAAISRFQRSAMLDVLNSDYVRLARAKGLRNRVVMRRHALRTALIPIATFAPLTVAAALGGAIITEQIFNWRGLGTFVIQAIIQGDTYAVMAFLIITGTLVVIANLIADLLYGVLDPRIRYE